MAFKPCPFATRSIVMVRSAGMRQSTERVVRSIIVAASVYPRSCCRRMDLQFKPDRLRFSIMQIMRPACVGAELIGMLHLDSVGIETSDVIADCA